MLEFVRLETHFAVVVVVAPRDRFHKFSPVHTCLILLIALIRLGNIVPDSWLHFNRRSAKVRKLHSPGEMFPGSR